MTLLAIELGSLNPEPCIPILAQTLETLESKRLYVVIYLTPELLTKLNTPAKRVGRYQALQALISALYVCTASKPTVNCDIIFADWCGYALEEEEWDYSILSIPESTSSMNVNLTEASPNIVTRLPRSVNSVRTVTYLNDGVVDNPDAYVSTSERDHEVVAGNNPTL